MLRISLSQLPEPPNGKTGWPWTEESLRLPEHRREGDSWPRISVITPSFNQAQFIEETIRSILLQGYPNLEYFIMDGGSTDGSVEIIKKYSPWLSYWISEKDNGQSDAINRGLKMASGDFATWINSDDLLAKNALFEQASRIGFANKHRVHRRLLLYRYDQQGNFTCTPAESNRSKISSASRRCGMLEVI